MLMIKGNADTKRYLQSLKDLVGVPVSAVWGDHNGSMYYARSYTTTEQQGRTYPARLMDGYDATNEVVVPQTVIPVMLGLTVKAQRNIPIKVVKLANGQYIAVDYDDEGLKQLGIDPAQFRDTATQPSYTFRDDIMTGALLMDVDSSGVPTKKTRKYDYEHIGFDGAIHNWKLGASTALDYTADYPSAGYERYALEYYDPVSTSTSYTLTDTQLSVTAKDLSAEKAILVAKLPHQLVHEGRMVRLDGWTGKLQQVDYRTDFRTLWDVPMPTAFATKLIRNWITPDNHQQVFFGQTDDNGYQHIIDGEMIEL